MVMQRHNFKLPSFSRVLVVTTCRGSYTSLPTFTCFTANQCGCLPPRMDAALYRGEFSLAVAFTNLSRMSFVCVVSRIGCSTSFR